MAQVSEITLSGADLQPITGERVTADHFGGVFTGYRSIGRFDSFLDTTQAGLVRWPGGHAAESADWYGLEFHDLVDPDSPKAGLSAVLDLIAADDRNLALVIPTSEFANDLSAGQSKLRAFLDRLFAEELGPLPAKITLEIGNEYYAISEFSAAPARYGAVANAMLETIGEFRAEFPGPLGADLVTAVQLGRTASDDSAIRSSLSQTALAEVDALIYHRYSWTMDGADSFVTHHNAAVSNWIEDGAHDDLGVFVSEWNIASWSRTEALNAYVSQSADRLNIQIDPAAIDLDARNDADFEHFWQTGQLRGPNGQTIQTQYGIAQRDYGLAQASGMLEVFSALLETGADAASLYGIDTGHAARVSFGDQQFVGAAMFQMMSETLPGTSLLNTGLENARDDQLNVHAFEGDGRHVFYLSADAFETGQTELNASFDLSDLELEIGAISARRLTSTLDADWREEFGVVDIAGVDETPESRLYERGVISSFDVTAEADIIDLTFTSEYEVIELVIDKTIAADIPDAPQLIGGDGDDELTGTTGDDIMTGGAGEDVIRSGAGDDQIDGGDQSDLIYAGGGDDFVFSGLGRDEVYLGSGNDTFVDGNQNSSWGASTIYGGSGNDHITARGGDDALDGGTGDDIIDAGQGNDQINPGSGHNVITGGDGQDEFIFDALSGSTRITDFSSKYDQINLSALVEDHAQYSIHMGDNELTFVGRLDGGAQTQNKTNLNIDVEQVGEDVVVYIAQSIGDQSEAHPYIVLENTDIETLSFDDFIL